jgi:hypothetical protein
LVQRLAQSSVSSSDQWDYNINQSEKKKKKRKKIFKRKNLRVYQFGRLVHNVSRDVTTSEEVSHIIGKVIAIVIQEVVSVWTMFWEKRTGKFKRRFRSQKEQKKEGHSYPYFTEISRR